MLKHLTIRNLAIIDSLDLEFNTGFTVLTGETGAGKSILIDAIGLAMGTRADAALVRAGQEKAEISASFELQAGSVAANWLGEHDLADADDPLLLLIRRVVYAEGRTRSYVNGAAINAGQLRELGEYLIEIFGQSESQTLLRADVQRRLLDDYGSYPTQLAKVREAAHQYAEAQRLIERLQAGGERDPTQLEFLRFQLSELEALNLADGELAQLEAEHRKLTHAERLLQDGGSAQEQLYGGDGSLYDQLATIGGTLESLVPIDDAFRAALDCVNGAQEQVREAADSLRHVLERLDLDPERLALAEQRMTAVHEMARKHRIKPAELGTRLLSLQAQLDESEHAAGRLGALEKQKQQALSHYRAAAKVLSAERRKAAQRFDKLTTELVRQLGMPNAQFITVVEPLDDDQVRTSGGDDVRFDFSANPGQPPRALAKVASGGELSRVSLAIQVATLSQDGATTMIFDEVDAGISGGVAEIVGQQLRKLGGSHQVLSVTHLAQVAAQGHAHYAIRKEIRAGQTYTRVEPMSAAKRVEELARMQGGVKVSDAALAHARDLLERASATG